MLVDHSEKFKKLRGTPTKSFNHDLFIIKFRDSIEFTKKQLFQLKMLQERQCLPSFSKRRQKKEEINRAKNEMRLLLAKLETFLKEINKLNYPEVLKRKMRDHFACIVHGILLEYREIQQKYLKKIKNLQIFDDLEDTRPFQENGAQNVISQKKQNDIESVRDSLYFITSMLLEMKTIIASQTEIIDRIDLLMDETNDNLEMTNDEIEKIPKKHGGLKDSFILILIFIMSLLLCLLMLRFYKKRLFSSTILVKQGLDTLVPKSIDQPFSPRSLIRPSTTVM
ncbi:SNARE protein TLG2/Syntaxin 16 [Pseudoloma neurophilia]|uniref:SNARE protein TLG2/Syntaxin 16 n=1 Tax=Pseudoloma neurophilia TaxID=146866 RepID=A0A0R0M0M5_9MICR|nr:SNARE protein TLG2/Syntaxin 16 [Pseudoloma neurophilia]